MAPLVPHLIERPFVAQGTVIVPDASDAEQSLQSQYPISDGFQPATVENEAAREEASKLQACWTEEMERELGIPQGYLNVAVLLIKWCDKLDELRCEKEVRELEDLFKGPDGFNFQVSRIELDNLKNPQLQLNAELGEFIRKHDGPYNLLIIYYSGHGILHNPEGQDRVLKFHASSSIAQGRIGKPYPAVVSWKKVEETLMNDVESNVLAILDTCFAGDLQKGGGPEETRLFEILAAAGPGRTTSSPGPKSFTRAVIRQLKELLKEKGDTQFSSYTLCQKICNDLERRRNPPLLFPRIPQSERHISFGRLKPTEVERKDNFLNTHPSSFLTLRVALSDRLPTEDQIRTLAKAFSRAARESDVKVQSIDWIGHRVSHMQYLQSTFNVALAGQRWLARVRSKRSPIETGKRRRSEASHEDPLAHAQKRLCADNSGMLKVSEVPNTPESTDLAASESE